MFNKMNWTKMIMKTRKSKAVSTTSLMMSICMQLIKGAAFFKIVLEVTLNNCSHEINMKKADKL